MYSSPDKVGEPAPGDGVGPKDMEMLDRLQKTAFDSLAKSTNPRTGLVADRSLDKSAASAFLVRESSCLGAASPQTASQEKG